MAKVLLVKSNYDLGDSNSLYANTENLNVVAWTEYHFVHIICSIYTVSSKWRRVYLMPVNWPAPPCWWGFNPSGDTGVLLKSGGERATRKKEIQKILKNIVFAKLSH